MCKLSIIVPVYQAENYLEDCLDSILHQSYTNFELILVDDGSTDLSPDICDNYAKHDSRVRVIHQKNGGQAHARNVGIELATGQYVGFVDNDDVVLDSLFKVLVNNSLKVDADISAVSFVQVDEDGDKEHVKHTHNKYIYLNNDGVKEILQRDKLDIYVWTKIYKKEFLDVNEIRFESGRSDEDILFNFKAFSLSKTSIFQDTPLYIYRHRTLSTSRSYKENYVNDYLKNTWYRVNKIEKYTESNYPQLIYLAKRQKIIYCLQMLSAIFRSSEIDCKKYYFEIMAFLKSNKWQVVKEKKYLGMRYIGIILLLFSPNNLYFIYRRWKDAFE